MKRTGLGANLRYWRQKRGLTQEQLAQAVGIIQNTIARYESGVNEPLLSKAVQLADALSISVDALVSTEIADDGVGDGRPPSDARPQLPAAALIAMLREAGYRVMQDITAPDELYITAPSREVDGKSFTPINNVTADGLRDFVVQLLKESAAPHADAYARDFIAILDKARAAAEL